MLSIHAKKGFTAEHVAYVAPLCQDSCRMTLRSL